MMCSCSRLAGPCSGCFLALERVTWCAVRVYASFFLTAVFVGFMVVLCSAWCPLPLSVFLVFVFCFAHSLVGPSCNVGRCSWVRSPGPYRGSVLWLSMSSAGSFISSF